MYININNQNIYYQKIGKGKNLVMLHGWGTDVSTFWPIVEYLKDNFTVWLIDLPGFGKSDLPKRVLTISDYAKLIAKFIKVQKISNPVLFGHSYGGRISIKLTTFFPNLIDKLILEGSAGIRPDKTFIQSLAYPFAKIGHFLLPDIFHIRSKARERLYRQLQSDYADTGAMRDIFVETVKEDLTNDLPKIKQETLLIWGEEDNAVPLKYGKKMYQLISNSKLVIIEGARHFPHVTNPERVATYVKDFV